MDGRDSEDDDAGDRESIGAESPLLSERGLERPVASELLSVLGPLLS